MRNPAVQIAIDHFLDIRAKGTVCPPKSVFIDVFEDLEMVFDTLVIRRALGVALTVNSSGHRYVTSISD